MFDDYLCIFSECVDISGKSIFVTMSANTPALDPEEFVQCPYEENHKVRNKRMQIHLIQCRKVS